MTGVAITVTDDGVAGIGPVLRRWRLLGHSPRPIWDAIGQYGESSTRLRFARQVGPDGARWKPSQRAQATGGQTLVHTTRLLRSLAYQAGASFAEWGSNVVYAAIHQTGGKIERLAHSSWLRLRTDAGGRLLRQADNANLARFAKATHKRAVQRRYTVGAYTINMPARPYLGVNEQDGREMLAVTLDVIDAAGRGAA